MKTPTGGFNFTLHPEIATPNPFEMALKPMLATRYHASSDELDDILVPS